MPNNYCTVLSENEILLSIRFNQAIQAYLCLCVWIKIPFSLYSLYAVHMHRCHLTNANITRSVLLPFKLYECMELCYVKCKNCICFNLNITVLLLPDHKQKQGVNMGVHQKFTGCLVRLGRDATDRTACRYSLESVT